MADSWSDRLCAVGQNLLTLEVNTFTADGGCSAQKMPELPLALHTLAQAYANYVADAGFPVSRALLIGAAERVRGTGRAAAADSADQLLRQLQGWKFTRRKYTDNEIASHLDEVQAECDASDVETNLTNGSETFEALQWAAWGALQTRHAGGILTGQPNTAVLARINANSRQIKEAALRVEKQNASSVATRAAPPGQTVPRLFGGTIEQTARALFDHPRPVFTVDPDVNILIRKAWDLGTKCVCLQTVLQVDGDIMQVIGALTHEERTFLALVHKEAVRESVTQWRALFDLIRLLAGDVGRIVFGR